MARAAKILTTPMGEGVGIETAFPPTDRDALTAELKAEREASVVPISGAAPALSPAAELSCERVPVMVPLSSLKRDPDNVRRGTKGDLEQLAADVLAHGVLQNIIVQVDPADGLMLVKAGDRRFRACQLLLKRGAIGKDYAVPALVLADGETAREAGLAENFQRLAMGAADEARAFAEAVAGDDEAGVAARFGVTVRHVRQRLRLAGLAPVVLEALAKGKITLDEAQAYASVPDAERQAKVFGEGAHNQSAHEVRRRMQQAGYAASSPRAKFVGRESYAAVGGSFALDLFVDGDAEHWLDDAIVDKLAGEKLIEEAAALRKRFGFDRVIPVLKFADADAVTQGLTMAGRWTDWTQKPEADRAALVVTAEIAPDGSARIADALAWFAKGDGVKPTLREALPPSAERDDDPAPVVAGGAPSAETEPEAKGLSQALRDALAMRRRDVLAFELCADTLASTEMARDLAGFMLLESVRTRFPDRTLGSAITAHETNEPVRPGADGFLPWHDDELSQDLARAWTGGDEPLDETWRGMDSAVLRFAAFRQLETADKARWLARGVAASLTAYAEFGQGVPFLQLAIAAGLAAANGRAAIDVSEYWRPTAVNFFDRCGKAACLAFLLDGVDGAKDFPGLEGWGKLKKAELAALCEDLAAGNTGPIEVALKAKADDKLVKKIAARFAAWLPKEMTFGELGK